MSLFLNLKDQRGKQWGLALVVLLVGLVLDGEGQSGRRASKPASAVPTSPAISDIASEKPPANEKRLGDLPAKVRLLVGRQPTSRHLLSEDQILASFVKQLNRYENIEVTSIGDYKEGQAVERAKAESEAMVVLLKFEIDDFQSGTIIVNSQDLQVEYSVLAPITGKRQTKGKVYFQAISGSRIRRSDWPNGTPIKITAEATGIEAADGLYFWLRLAAAKKAALP